MASTRTLSLVTALLAFAGMSAQVSTAFAERPLELGVTGYQDKLFSNPDPAVHDLWLNRTKDAGATIVVPGAFWDQIAASTPPAHPENPGDPSYDWTELDAAVRNAAAHGFQVMILVTSAPQWAEGPNRPPVNDHFPAGSWKPDPDAFKAFATAITSRYSGNFVDPSNLLAGPLPAVHLWEVWAEPNIWPNLTPQYDGKKEFAADRYRQLLNGFYDAAKSVSPSNTIVTGGLAPYGDDPGGDRTRPLVFFRDLLCLRKNLKAASCPAKPKFDVLADNPINLSGGPRRSAINPDDVTSADLGHVADTLHAAERAHTIKPKGKHPLWATEFWYNSDPPHNGASPPQRQARWVEESMYLFWKAGASAAIALRIADDNDSQNGVDGTGLYFANGNPKPALTAFRFPFVTERKSHSKVRAWGRAPVAGTLRIERKAGHGWKKVHSEQVAAADVFTANLHLKGKAKLRATVAGQKSLSWLQNANNKPSYHSEDPLSVISPRLRPLLP